MTAAATRQARDSVSVPGKPRFAGASKAVVAAAARAVTWGQLRYRERLLKGALAGHPKFRLPVAGGDQASAVDAERSNFGFFMAQRRDRVAHIRFLISKCGAKPDVDPGYGPWLDRFGAALVAAEGPQAQAALIDLAIATGEAAIERDPRWGWEADAASCIGAVLGDGYDRHDMRAAVVRCCWDRHPGKALATLLASFGRP